VSRSWLLYLDDLIDSAEKIGRFVAGRTLDNFCADEAARAGDADYRFQRPQPPEVRVPGHRRVRRRRALDHHREQLRPARPASETLFGGVRINIFNLSKINSEVRGGRSPRIKRLSE
jgi:hypothetical protein